jgi:hypothetical protein
MSWLFSQALVEEYSVDTSSDGEPSALLNGNPTQQAYCAPDKMTVFSRLSRFGMTFKPLTVSRGEELLTLYLAAFPAKTSAQLEKEQALTESAAECGEKWHASFTKYSPDLRLWKTHQCSLLGDLEPFLETWPQWGLMRNGECWEQQTLAQTTRGTGFGLLPTPLASNTKANHLRSNGRPPRSYWATPAASDGQRAGTITDKMTGQSLPQMVNTPAKWPMPCATDYKGSGQTGQLRDRLDYAAERGATKSNNYATPQARDFRSGSTDWWDNPDRSRNLNDQIGGKLNPTWVEWLMGWPLGWTDLKPLAMDKSHCVPQQRGESCNELL